MPRTVTSRNAPCPCHSGRKFKHCCLTRKGTGRFVPTTRTGRTDLLARPSAPPPFAATRPATLPSAKNWRRVHVTLTTTTGQVVSAVLLHTAAWLASRGVAVGAAVEMNLPGIGVTGSGTVTKIEPSPVGASREGQALTVVNRAGPDVAPLVDPPPAEELKALVDMGDGRVGQVVLARPAGWTAEHRQALDRTASGECLPDRADGWRLVMVAATAADGAEMHVAFLETAGWVAVTGVTVGERVAVNLPGREVRWAFRGSGRVIGVEPSPFVPGQGGPWGFVGSSRPGPRRTAGEVKAPIESIQVGEYVLTFGDEWDAPPRPREPAVRYRVELQHERDGGGWVDVVLLRTAEWVAANRVAAGGTLELGLEEMGVCGPAEVLAVEPVLVSLHGEGRMVTGTFRHSDGDVGELRVWGEPEPIGVTAGHLFWSADRQDWVPVGELQPGETVEVWSGLQMVESYTPNVRVGPVHNIEVEGDHCYRVGAQGILVHNTSVSLLAESNDPNPRTCGSNVHPRVPPYPGSGQTLGILVVAGIEIPLRSGGGPPGSWLIENLEGGTGSGLNAVIPTHVEGHAVAIMHKHSLSSAVLFINQAPCPRSAMCRFNLHRILPAGSTLIVFFLEEDGMTVSCWSFRAGVPRWEVC